MACETCDHTVQKLGNHDNPSFFWCPRCGTLKTTCSTSPKSHEFDAPTIVEKTRSLCKAIEDFQSYDIFSADMLTLPALAASACTQKMTMKEKLMTKNQPSPPPQSPPSSPPTVPAGDQDPPIIRFIRNHNPPLNALYANPKDVPDNLQSSSQPNIGFQSSLTLYGCLIFTTNEVPQGEFWPMLRDHGWILTEARRKEQAMKGIHNVIKTMFKED